MYIAALFNTSKLYVIHFVLLEDVLSGVVESELLGDQLIKSLIFMPRFTWAAILTFAKAVLVVACRLGGTSLIIFSTSEAFQASIVAG